MSELPEGVAPARPAAPRPSAAAVLLERAGDGFRVLLGRRAAGARFMPGHLSFPGGAIEPADRADEPGGFARCASRELCEETGLAVEPAAWLDAGERITPPLFPIRFQTRFLVAPWPEAARGDELAPASAECETLELAEPGEVLERWERGRAHVPPPVLPILRALDAARGGSLDEAASRIAAANALEERSPRIEFHPRVWMLPQPTATLPPATHTNTWMPGGTRYAVIDPGSGDPAELARLAEVVSRRRRELDEAPAVVLLTHEHRDHTAGAAATARALGVPLCAHPVTLERTGLGATPGVEVAPLADGESIDLGGVRLEALYTPGHAEGHVAFWLPGLGLLVCGDLVSGVSTILIDPERGDMDVFLASLARVRGLDGTTLLPGHGPPLPWRALSRVIDHRLERERRVVEALGRAPRRLGEIAAAAYATGQELPAALIERQTLAHLVRLERLGAARRDDQGGTRWSRRADSGP